MLVDTSSWIEALRRNGAAAVKSRVEQHLLAEEAAWCEMVRLELWNGAKGASEVAKLTEMDRVLPRLEMSAAVWDLACKIGQASRASGLNVPSTDVLIFACAKHHNAALESVDQHFGMLASLQLS